MPFCWRYQVYSNSPLAFCQSYRFTLLWCRTWCQLFDLWTGLGGAGSEYHIITFLHPGPRVNVEPPKFSFPCYLSSEKSHVWKTGRGYSGRCKAPRCIGKFRGVRQYHTILGEGLIRSNRALYGIIWLHRMSDMHRFPDDFVEVAKYSCEIV